MKFFKFSVYTRKIHFLQLIGTVRSMQGAISNFVMLPRTKSFFSARKKNRNQKRIIQTWYCSLILSIVFIGTINLSAIASELISVLSAISFTILNPSHPNFLGFAKSDA